MANHSEQLPPTEPNSGRRDSGAILEAIKSVLSEGKEILAILVNIATAIIAVIIGHKDKFGYDRFPMIIEVLNLITLVIALVMLSRKYELTVKENPDQPDKLSELQELANLEKTDLNLDAKLILDDEKMATLIRNKIKRINKIVAQLINAHKGFALFLVFLYALLFIYDANNEHLSARARMTKAKQIEDSIKLYKKNLDTIEQYNILAGLLSDSNAKKRVLGIRIDSTCKQVDDMLKSYKVWLVRKEDSPLLARIKKQTRLVEGYRNYDKIENDKLNHFHSLVELLLEKDDGNKNLVSRILLIIMDNFFNILSAAFLFVAFTVLYYKTLEDDNTTQRIDYLMIFSIAGALLMFIGMTITIGLKGQSLLKLIVMSRILSGLFNGIGMALLFSRFISMEYFFNSTKKWAKYYYSIGTVVILPVYAVVQPLWGLFETEYAGDQYVIKAIVLLLCLWGKIFFFLMVYSMLKNKWLHAYLYTLKFSEGRIMEISKKMSGITSFLEETQD